MPFYFPTLDQHGGMEKKAYKVRSLLTAYAQFESYLLLPQLQHAFVGHSLFKEHCSQFIPFVIEPSSSPLLVSFVASFVVFDASGIL